MAAIRFFLVWSRGAAFHRSRWAPIEPALAVVNADFDPICRLTESGPAPRHAGGALFAMRRSDRKAARIGQRSADAAGKGNGNTPEQQTLSAQDALI